MQKRLLEPGEVYAFRYRSGLPARYVGPDEETGHLVFEVQDAVTGKWVEVFLPNGRDIEPRTAVHDASWERRRAEATAQVECQRRVRERFDLPPEARIELSSHRLEQWVAIGSPAKEVAVSYEVVDQTYAVWPTRISLTYTYAQAEQAFRQ